MLKSNTQGEQDWMCNHNIHSCNIFLIDGSIQNERMLNNRQRNALVWVHVQ